MKKSILILPFVLIAIASFSQDGNPYVNPVPNPTFSSSGRHNVSQDVNSVRGNPFGSPNSFFSMLSNRLNFNFNVPTQVRFRMASGVSFQAGLLMNSRQPKIGATFSTPRGFNFSAGLGANMPSFGRQGFNYVGRTPGIQVSASYRIFRRK